MFNRVLKGKVFDVPQTSPLKHFQLFLCLGEALYLTLGLLRAWSPRAYLHLAPTCLSVPCSTLHCQDRLSHTLTEEEELVFVPYEPSLLSLFCSVLLRAPVLRSVFMPCQWKKGLFCCTLALLCCQFCTKILSLPTCLLVLIATTPAATCCCGCRR